MSAIKYTKALGKLVAGDIQPDKSLYIIIPAYPNNWVVRTYRSKRALKKFTSREDAIAYAKEKASKNSGRVYINNKAGMLEDKISYK